MITPMTPDEAFDYLAERTEYIDTTVDVAYAALREILRLVPLIATEPPDGVAEMVETVVIRALRRPPYPTHDTEEPACPR